MKASSEALQHQVEQGLAAAAANVLRSAQEESDIQRRLQAGDAAMAENESLKQAVQAKSTSIVRAFVSSNCSVSVD